MTLVLNKDPLREPSRGLFEGPFGVALEVSVSPKHYLLVTSVEANPQPGLWITRGWLLPTQNAGIYPLPALLKTIQRYFLRDYG